MIRIILFSKLIQFQSIKRISLLNYCTSKAVKTTTIISSENNPEIETIPSSVKAPEVPHALPVQDNIIETRHISHDLLKIKIHPSTDNKISSFDEVPGPPFLSLLSKLWYKIPYLSTEITLKGIQNIMSVGSILNWGGNHYIINYLLNEYGPVVRLHGPFGGDVVLLNRPEHIRTIFENEGPYPIRSSFQSVEKYHLKNRKHKLGGLFLICGQDWKKIRNSVEYPLNFSTLKQFDKMETICDEFIERILMTRTNQEEMTNDFKNEIYKWSLECLCLTLLDEKVGYMSKSATSTISDPSLLLKGLEDATRSIQRCESGLHLWKFFDTFAYKSLMENCDIIENILQKYIDKAQTALMDKKNIQTEENRSYLEKILLTDEISKEDVATILLDMLLIGVNTITHTVIYLLYHLAKSPKYQRELFKEIERRSSGKFTSDSIISSILLQACIKESLRLKPPLPLLGRVTTTDLNIYNYLIPKGTYIIMATNSSSLKPEIFDDPDKFLPERWLTSDNITDNMFATLPFGYGPKGCLSKQLVEMEVGLLISKLIKKFRIEYNYGDIKTSNKVFSLPKHSLKFRFIERI